jgi:hypothetical protein
MSPRELAQDMAKGAPKALEIIQEAVGDTDQIVTRTLAAIIQGTVLETWRRLAQEHIFTQPSRN